MPREIITVQVGQCGNQIGCRFWELALREHALHNSQGIYDDALSSFFRNVDTRSAPPLNLPVGDGTSFIKTLKARSVIVDMEEGVINEMLKGPLGEVLDNQQLLYDVSGAGNNWAHGHHGYGPQYRAALADRLYRCAEEADSLQAFMLLHSLGGGTGSGLGTFILDLLEEEFSDVLRFTASVFPSEDDDVVTSPYNAMLALDRLLDSAHCCFPIENQALMDICGRAEQQLRRQEGRSDCALTGQLLGKGKPFDSMNSIAATMLLHLTCSMRFEGDLNVDLNDITMNMVPYPRQHFVLSSMSPLLVPRDQAKLAAPRSLDHLFTEAFSRQSQLIKADPGGSTYLATALVMRGAVTISDISRNLARLRPHMRLARWNSEGFKLGICSKPPVGQPYACLCLANNCCIANTFQTMQDRFNKLYKRRIFVHHYEQYMEAAGFQRAVDNVADLIQQYKDTDCAQQMAHAHTDVLGSTATGPAVEGLGDSRAPRRLRFL